ncbi:conserved Plasmodium protein, unknown function [Plasmodium gallinaceum]|uniref:PH domain-containing protein n=1 Tax=Plasmodium gallinaceum TaxID=5849 RepID=A0A1J1GXC5_PLAGA|nr:conserved Plasmodium protein, unknown function [Plasmodium gallinaceum]CRG97209.1 conserved Plasmodium protein, unknown function [Plasmodium gallinaceum]
MDGDKLIHYKECFVKDIKKKEFYDTKIDSEDKEISSFSSMKFSNLEKEFQTLHESPIKEKMIDKGNFTKTQDLSELKNDKKKQLEKYNTDSFCEMENKSFVEYEDEYNLSGVNFIDKILKNIQNDNILKSNGETFSNHIKLYENCDLKPNNVKDMCNNDMKNTLYIWNDNKKLSYSWYSFMKKEDIKKSICNFCMNIINDEFYLIRLEKLKDENLCKEDYRNIEKFCLNENEIMYYKICESYNIEDLGNIKNNEEYLIKKKNINNEKLEDSLNFPEVLMAIEYAKEGSNLLKHTVFNIPHLRFFFLSKNLKYIKWFSSRKSDEESKIYFRNINSLEINNIGDKLFENYKIDLLKKLSFCITYNNEKKKIILTCKNLQEFNYWVTAVRALMFHFRKMKVTKFILLSHLNEFYYVDKNKKYSETSLKQTDQVNLFCELKSIDEKENEKMKELESLKNFNLYDLISFPDYNIYQIKTKFYLLKEKLYKYRILIEQEIDDFHTNENIKDLCKTKNNPDSKSTSIKPLNNDMIQCSNYEINDKKKNITSIYDLHQENSYQFRSSSDNNSEIHNLYKNYSNDDYNNFSDVNDLNEDKKNIKQSMNTKLKTNFLPYINDNSNSKNANEQKEIETSFKINNIDNTTKIKEIYSLNNRFNLNINKINILEQLEENNIEEDSNEFKLFLIIKIFNKIDKKLRNVQKNILEIVKILKVEESKQKRNEIKFFSVDNILKYTTIIYKTIENKIVNNESNVNNENNINVESMKFLNSQKNNNEIDKKNFNNSFNNIDNISNPSIENLINMNNNEKHLSLQKQTFPEKKTLDSNKLIHNILFNMWLCEIELGNVEDIFTSYTYSKKKNFLIGFDGSKILKTISQRISTTFMKYINF